jgi:hypothetical protein
VMRLGESRAPELHGRQIPSTQSSENPPAIPLWRSLLSEWGDYIEIF